MQDRIYFIKTAASFSENLPLAIISSKSSPPLQILEMSAKSLLSDDVVSLFILEILVHFDNIRVILKGVSLLKFWRFIWIWYDLRFL